MAIINPQIGTGLYSERARGLLGMGMSTVAQATTSPTEIMSRGLDSNQRSLDSLTRLSREQVGLLKQQVKLLNAMKSGNWGVGDTVATLFATKFLGKIGAVGAGIGGVIGGAVSGGVSGIATLVKNSFSFATRGVVTTIGKLTSFLTSGIGGAVEAVAGMFGGFFKSLPTVLEAVGRPLQRVLSALTNMTSGAMGLLNTGIFASVSKVAGVVSKIAGKFLVPIAALFAAFDGFNGFTNAEEILGRDGVGIVGKIGSAISSVINGVLLGIPDWIADKLGFKNLNQMFDSAGMGAYNFFSQSMGEMATTLVQGLANFGQSVISKVADYLPSLDSFGTMLSGVASKAVSVVTSIGSWIGDAVTSAWNSVSSIIKGAIDSLSGAWISESSQLQRVREIQAQLNKQIEQANEIAKKDPELMKEIRAYVGSSGPRSRRPEKDDYSPMPSTSGGISEAISDIKKFGPKAGSTATPSAAQYSEVLKILGEPAPMGGSISSDSTGFPNTPAATPAPVLPAGAPKGIILDPGYDLIQGPRGWVKVPKRKTSMATTGVQVASNDPNYWPSIDNLTPDTPIGVGVSAIGNAAMDEMSKVSRSSMASNAATVKAVTEHLDESDKKKKDKIDDLMDLLKESGKLAYGTMSYFGGVASDMASAVPDAMRVGAGGAVSGNGTSGGFTGNGAGTQSPSGRPAEASLPDGARGKLDPNSVFSEAKKAAQSAGLVGTVPPDGARYGITTGSADEWANFITRLSYHESGLDTGNVGDAGQFGGHGSRGLLQLSPQDAPNYGLNGGKQFSYDQLADPKTNLAAGAQIMSSLLKKNGTIQGGLGQYWGPISREGWTPGNGRDRAMKYRYDASGNVDTLAPGSSGVVQAQGSVADIRKLPIDPKLVTVLDYAAQKNGVKAEVFSGGQSPYGSGGPRTGSQRHDNGGAGDLKLYTTDEKGNKRYLDMTNPDDLKIMSNFVRDSAAAGATGIGGAPGYMGPQSLHVGFGSESVWGAGGSSATAPDWLRRAYAEGRANQIDVSAWAKGRQPSTALSYKPEADPFGVTGFLASRNATASAAITDPRTKAAAIDVGKSIGTGVAEANAEKPTIPTFTPVPIYDPLSSIQTPVQGSAVTQNPTGAPSYNVPSAPSTREIASIDELSMLLINSSMMS